MKHTGILAGAIGAAANFLLVLVKVYVGVSTGSLTIYCDAMNNLGDTFACVLALAGFWLIRRLGEPQSRRTQSLFTLFISIFIAVTGVYFVYHGLERLLYPLPVAYMPRYAAAVTATIAVKILLGVLFYACNRRAPSPVLRALLLDSFLDCFITAAALMSLLLVNKINYAVDGAFAVLTGSVIAVSAVRNLLRESRALINNEYEE